MHLAKSMAQVCNNYLLINLILFVSHCIFDLKEGLRRVKTKRLVLPALIIVVISIFMTSCNTNTEPTSTPSEKDANGNWIFDDEVVVGRVVPLTGELSSFGEGTPYVEQTAVDAINANGGVVLDGKRCKMEMLFKDSGSGIMEAGDAATELIKEGIDIMIVSNTADTVVPVSTVCEREGIACISVDAPASAWAEGGPYKNSWHTFFDNEREMMCFLDAWENIESNKTIGLITANDSEGIEITTFITEFAEAKGYAIVDPGRYRLGEDDYTNIVETFKARNCDIILGVMKTPDFTAFWNECKKLNYTPKMCTVAKACLFSSDVEKMGAGANGLITEVWWSEDSPFSSSINGWTAGELAEDYRENYSAENSVLPPSVGYKHANVEILYDILNRAGTLDLDSINEAAAATELDTVVGHVAFGDNHISVMPCVTGQWVMNEDGSFHQEIVANSQVPQLKITADIFLLKGSAKSSEKAPKKAT